jgi:cation-transporting ATPase 13A3/4/5
MDLLSALQVASSSPSSNFSGPILLGMSWAMSLASPAHTLKPRRPTARLLGPETLLSTLGMILINALFVALGILLLYRQDFMNCNQFDAEFIDTLEWWRLQDNYEAEVVGLISIWQVLYSDDIDDNDGAEMME